MEIDLELHSPGLDMSSNRWTHHLIFMQEVHKRKKEVIALGKKCYEQHGRGTFFVDRQKWRAVIRDAVSEQKEPFPGEYISQAEIAQRFSFGIMNEGFRQAIAEYDPARHMVLTVQHYPDGPMSCYVLRPLSESSV